MARNLHKLCHTEEAACRTRYKHLPKLRCEYCHEWVDREQHKVHLSEHSRLRPDGQQNEYVTLPPEKRYQGLIDEVPKVYRHLRCGCCTGMPEEIIRTYLRDPFAYADRTYCSGCHKHVPCRELVWIETGENMQSYNNRLRGYQSSRKGIEVRGIGKAAILMGRSALYLVMICLILAAVLGWLWVRTNTEP